MIPVLEFLLSGACIYMAIFVSNRTGWDAESTLISVGFACMALLLMFDAVRTLLEGKPSQVEGERTNVRMADAQENRSVRLFGRRIRRKQ